MVQVLEHCLMVGDDLKSIEDWLSILERPIDLAQALAENIHLNN